MVRRERMGQNNGGGSRRLGLEGMGGKGQRTRVALVVPGAFCVGACDEDEGSDDD